MTVSSLHLQTDALRVALALRGLDQRDLAQEAGLSEATVSHAITGRAVNAQTLRRIAAALERLPKMPGAAELVAGAPIAQMTASAD
jgi:transcriptional regulator with XRE-family HTH domain